MEERFDTRLQLLAAVALACIGMSAGCSNDDTGIRSGASTCAPGSASQCICPGGAVQQQVCALDGKSYMPCQCDVVNGNAGTGSGSGAGVGATTAGTVAQAGTAAEAGTGVAAGTVAQAGTTAGTGGAAGTEGTAGDGAAGTSSADMFEELRQVCIDTINMYRATKSLHPLMRPDAAQETCSDTGAKKDGDANVPHGSAGDCPGYGSQDTCPGWGVGGFTGNATVADALKGCLKAMWEEGEPPVSRAECEKDFAGCFSKYGHYLNMTREGTYASCGFYEMTNGKWWMNQDFK